MPQRAGEGGGLPKGLSLFRFVLFSCIMLGAVYGGASLYFNEPPPPNGSLPDGSQSWNWRPSPLWLPTYLLMKLEWFITLTKSGYVFRTRMAYASFSSFSLVLGMALGFFFGWFAGERARKWWVVHR